MEIKKEVKDLIRIIGIIAHFIGIGYIIASFYIDETKEQINIKRKTNQI